MTPAEKKRVHELTEEIAGLKKHLVLKSAVMTNRDTADELEKIGELLSEKNALTGLHEDAVYLYLDDGEWFREVKGFVGDDSGMHDCMGITLKIGDTVSLNGYPRLIMQDISKKSICASTTINPVSKRQNGSSASWWKKEYRLKSSPQLSKTGMRIYFLQNRRKNHTKHYSFDCCSNGYVLCAGRRDAPCPHL